MFFATWYFFYITISYKAFGESKGLSDYFLTICGATGSLVNAGARLLIGTLMDYVGFKKIFFVVLIIQIGISSTFDMIADVSALYMIWLYLTNVV